MHGMYDLGALAGATLLVAFLSWLFRRGRKRRRPIIAAGFSACIAVTVSLFTTPDFSLYYVVGAILVWAWMSISDRQKATAKHAARETGNETAPNEPPRQASPSPGSTASWPDVLEVKPDASWNEIRAAYKQRATEYHPDKAATLPKGFREFAAQRMVELNEAFASAKMHQDGWADRVPSRNGEAAGSTQAPNAASSKRPHTAVAYTVEPSPEAWTTAPEGWRCPICRARGVPSQNKANWVCEQMHLIPFDAPTPPPEPKPIPHSRAWTTAPEGWRCPICGARSVPSQNEANWVCERMHLSPSGGKL
jgi:rubredoxin